MAEYATPKLACHFGVASSDNAGLSRIYPTLAADSPNKYCPGRFVRLLVLRSI